MKYIMLSLFFLIISLSAWSGAGAGNGGDGIVCPWRSPIMIDYYESLMSDSSLRGFRPINEYSASDERIIVDDFLTYINMHINTSKNATYQNLSLSKLKRFYKNLKSLRKNFKRMDQWSKVGHLDDIADSNHQYMLPKNCKLVQLAKNIDGEITVNEEQFHNLPQEQKNILYFHEFIYTLGLKFYGHENSFATRYLTRSFLRAAIDRKSGKFDLNFLSGIDLFINTPNLLEFNPQVSTLIDYPFSTSLIDLYGSFHSLDPACPSPITATGDFYLNVTYKLEGPEGKIFEFKNEKFFRSTIVTENNLLTPELLKITLKGQQIFLASMDQSQEMNYLGITKGGEFFVTFGRKACQYLREK